MLLPKLKSVRLSSGGIVPAVAEFNNGYSFIVVDDGCWCVVNGNEFSAWVFPEATAVLKQLPDSPDEYGPYREWTTRIVQGV